jgi:isopenicillin-N N-acyltransferase-like protein
MRKASAAVCVVLLAVFLVGYALVDARRITSGEAYLPDPETTQRLERLDLSQKGDLLEFGDGSMTRRHGNIVLHLKGTPYEMGYQHGKLLRNEIQDSTVPVFADPISSIPKYRSMARWRRRLLLLYLEMTIYAPIEDNTPRDYLEELKGIADGSGLDYRTVFIANFLSDMNMIMVPRRIQDARDDFDLAAGCTSFAASGSATEDGKLVFGRNTDYSGQARWVRHQSVVLYEPRDALRYAKVSTAGLLKCNSAMNERGVVIGGHFMGFSGGDPAGVSFTILENEIMRNAAGIDDAVKILQDSPRGGAFGMVIADGKSGRAVAIEATREHLGVREMDRETIAMTNCAFTPALRDVDLLSRYNIGMRNILGRYERIEQLIRENYGRINPAAAAAFMGDHVDQVVGEERGTGATLCFEGNVTSAVFQPETGFFWVATGSEPACTNPYIGFDFDAEFQKTASRVQPKSLAGYQWKHDAKRKGLKKYMKALASYQDDPSDIDGIRAQVREALEADPQEVLYSRVLARILVYEEEYAEAVELLERSRGLDQTPNETALMLLLSAQALDLSGDRGDATERYRQIVSLRQSHGNDPLTGINQMTYGSALKYLRAPFSRRDLGGFEIGDGGLD